MPQTKNFTTRLPPHIHAELQRLKNSVPRHFREPSNSDMVGALLLRARRTAEGLLDDLAAYYDVRDAWEEDGREMFPDV